jgi:hypothetical protein
MIYCPYTDQDYPETECNSEHIIPLSLGGVNDFEIPVHRDTNSTIGSRIDAAMAEDFLVKMKRNRYDVRGHSGKEPVFVVKNANNSSGLPLQVALNRRTGLRVWSPRDREYVTDERASKVTLAIGMQLDTARKFVAKVALSAGYLVYGDLFRKHVKHQDLRTVMNFNPEDRASIQDNDARVDDRFIENENENESEEAKIFRALCAASEPYPMIGFAHGHGRFGVFVGILGDYAGMIHVPAQLEQFPKDGEHEMGHVIQLTDSGIVRNSMKHVLESFLAWSEKLKLDSALQAAPVSESS